MSGNFAFVTLVTSDHYLPGALAVAAALKDVHPSPPVEPEVPFQTVCLVTPETVDVKTIKLLRRAFDVVVGVEVIEAENSVGLRLLGRPDLSAVLTKLHIFRMTQYDKLIFLDADVLPLRPMSHLFTLPHEFAAIPDVGWPDIFNSGVMVLSPGEDKFNKIKEIVDSKGSWDGGDQGVLNEWRGGDWHRLSFTYNTTPTAAYTYAPAYERFGSQISAIHFIGPNKPWSSLQSRAPGSSASQKPPDALSTTSTSTTNEPPQRSYAYSALVDRWFDVYDKHYRPQAPSEEGHDYEVRRYESVWNEGPSTAEEIGTKPTAPSATLGLEDLRKAAIEGVHTGGATLPRDGEGEYRSLPLEGRIDLMRPQKERTKDPEPEPTLPLEAGRRQTHTPQVSHGQTQEEAHIAQVVEKSGPGEAPPAPSLPVPQAAPSIPAVSEHDGRPEDHSAPEHHRDDGGEQQQQQQPEHHYQPPPEYNAPRRQPSPPLITWNPAIEPPPNVAPPASAFRPDTFFPNAWDVSPGAARLHTSLTGAPTPDSSSFFQPPPPSYIPRHLIQEGHYTSVTGHSDHSSQESHPTPDRSKVTTVFPWEQKPRHTPGRVFPESDSRPPGVPYIEDTPPAPEFQPEPEAAPQQTQAYPVLHVASPPQSISPPGFSSGAYANAWDAVPSIQRYASKLVRPQPAPVPLMPPSPRGGRRRANSFRSWEERADANSMDGDDEDEGEDEEGDEWVGRPGSGVGGSRRERSVSGSRTSPPSDVAPASKIEYRSYGVQTDAKEVRSLGVQVSILPATKSDDAPVPKKASGAARPSSRRGTRASPPRIGQIELPSTVTLQELKADPDQMAAGSPSIMPAQFFTRPARPSLAPPPTGTMSPRLHDTLAFNSPKTTSPVELAPFAAAARAAAAAPAPRTLVPVVRTPSNETVDSPPTSGGPASPPDVLPIAASRKRGGRAWNPATGVDVFKRGSEEVLARFLRMGSWEDVHASAQTAHT